MGKNINIKEKYIPKEIKKDDEEIKEIGYATILSAMNGEVNENTLNKLSVEKYKNGVFLIKYDDEVVGYVESEDKLKQILNELIENTDYKIKLEQIEEEVQVVSQTKKEVKKHKQEVEESPSVPKTKIGYRYVEANLETYSLKLLAKLYKNSQSADINNEEIEKIREAIFYKLRDEDLSISEKIKIADSIFEVKFFKEKAIFYIFWGIKTYDEGKELINKVGKEKLKEVIQHAILFDGEFAEKYILYAKTPDKVRGFSIEKCPKKNNQGKPITKEVCDNFIGYVFALKVDSKDKNYNAMSRTISAVFDGDLNLFNETVIKSINDYKELKGELPSPIQKILEKRGVGATLHYILYEANIPDKYQKYWIAGALIFTAFKIIQRFIKSKHKGKMLLGLLALEFGSESKYGTTLFGVLGNLWYNGFDSLGETKDAAKKGLEHKEFAENLGFPTFVLFLMGDKKLKSIKGLSFKDGKTKFDVMRYIASLDDTDDIKAFLISLVQKNGERTVNRMFEIGFTRMGVNSKTYDKLKDKKISELYKGLVDKLKKEKEQKNGGEGQKKENVGKGTSGTSGNKAEQPAVGTLENVDSSKKAGSVGTGGTVDGGSVGSSAKDKSVVINTIPKTKADKKMAKEIENNPNLNQVQRGPDTTHVETREIIGNVYNVKVGADYISFVDKDGKTHQISIAFERNFLRGDAKKRYDLLSKVVQIWLVNAERKLAGLSGINNKLGFNKSKEILTEVISDIKQYMEKVKNSTFYDTQKYKDFVIDIFNKIFKVEGGYDWNPWSDKTDVIDEDDARTVYSILLNLGENITDDKYEDKLYEIYNTMKISFSGDGDSMIIGKDVAQKLLDTEYKKLQDDLYELLKKTNSKNIRYSYSEIMNSIKEDYPLEERQKVELRKKLQKLKEKTKKWIEDKNTKSKLGKIYWKAVSMGLIDKNKISEEQYLTQAYNQAFVKGAAIEVLKYLIGEKKYGRTKYEELYANIKGIDCCVISDENVEFVEQIGLIVLTSLIPGAFGYWAGGLLADGLIVASNVNRASKLYKFMKLAKIGISVGAGYGASMLDESIKEGKWVGTWKGYFEFLVFDGLFRVGGKMREKIFAKGGFLWKTGGVITLGELGIEAGVNIPRAFGGQELEFIPDNWTKQDVATALLIIGTIGAGHGISKFRISKGPNGEIKILEQKVDLVDGRISKLEADKQILETSKTNSEKQLKRYKETKEKLKQSVEQRSIEPLEKQIETIEQNIKNIESEIETNVKQIEGYYETQLQNRYDLSNIDGEINGLRKLLKKPKKKNISTLQRDLDLLSDLKRLREGKYDEIQDNVIKKSTQLSNIKTKLSELETEKQNIESLKRTIQDIRDDLLNGNYARFPSRKTTLENLDKNIKYLEIQIADLQSEISRLERSISRHKNRKSNYEDKISRLNNNIPELTPDKAKKTILEDIENLPDKNTIEIPFKDGTRIEVIKNGKKDYEYIVIDSSGKRHSSGSGKTIKDIKAEIENQIQTHNKELDLDKIKTRFSDENWNKQKEILDKQWDKKFTKSLDGGNYKYTEQEFVAKNGDIYVIAKDNSGNYFAVPKEGTTYNIDNKIELREFLEDNNLKIDGTKIDYSLEIGKKAWERLKGLKGIKTPEGFKVISNILFGKIGESLKDIKNAKLLGEEFGQGKIEKALKTLFTGNSKATFWFNREGKVLGLGNSVLGNFIKIPLYIAILQTLIDTYEKSSEFNIDGGALFIKKRLNDLVKNIEKDFVGEWYIIEGLSKGIYTTIQKLSLNKKMFGFTEGDWKDFIQGIDSIGWTTVRGSIYMNLLREGYKMWKE